MKDALPDIDPHDGDAFNRAQNTFATGDDYVLPTQREHAHRPMTGPEKLGWAVLIQALDDLRLRRNEPDGQDALAWLLSDDTTYAFSFVAIADVFNIDVAAFRAGVLQRLDSPGGLRVPRISDFFEAGSDPAASEEAA